MKVTESINLENMVRPLRQTTPAGSSRPPIRESNPQTNESNRADSPAPNAAPEQGATYVNYRVEKTSGTVVTTVIREQSGEVIRQIPPDENLKLAALLRQVLEKVLRK